MIGNEQEFATIEAVMKALYRSISGPPGGQDWALSRRLQHPDARLVRFGNIAQVFPACEARTAPAGGALIKRGMSLAPHYHDGARRKGGHVLFHEKVRVPVPPRVELGEDSSSYFSASESPGANSAP
jgi:hypothetical protein